LPYNAAVKVLAVINQKGGVGKTTTVANLGSALADRGVRVCLIDLDPQAHLTLHYGIEPGEALSMYDVLTGNKPLLEAAVNGKEKNVAVVPSVIDLAAAEIELVGTVGREQILRDSLRDTPLLFDLVMIDCPPSLGLLTLNALAAADEVIIPLQPHFLALQGLGKLLETVSLVQRRINPPLRVGGVVLCMYESNTRLSGEVVADVTQFLEAGRGSNAPWANARVFESVIRRNIKLAECPSYGKTIFSYEPGSRGAEDYAALADEFIESLHIARGAENATDETPAAGEAIIELPPAPPTESTPSIEPEENASEAAQETMPTPPDPRIATPPPSDESPSAATTDVDVNVADNSPKDGE